MKEEIFTLPELVTFVFNASHSNTKAFCRLGRPTQYVRDTLNTLLAGGTLNFVLVIDSDGMRHTLRQHGVAKSNTEALRGQIPITEDDLLALEGWLPSASIIKAGQTKPGKQPRVEMELIKTDGTTVVIMEWRPGRQQLALVTMYKKRPVV